jgi:hypothetical protein
MSALPSKADITLLNTIGMSALCHKRTSTDATLANNVLAHREQFHQSRLVELVNTSTRPSSSRPR